jgi:hypothetical protein
MSFPRRNCLGGLRANAPNLEQLLFERAEWPELVEEFQQLAHAHWTHVLDHV